MQLYLVVKHFRNDFTGAKEGEVLALVDEEGKRQVVERLQRRGWTGNEDGMRWEDSSFCVEFEPARINDIRRVR